MELLSWESCFFRGQPWGALAFLPGFSAPLRKSQRIPLPITFKCLLTMRKFSEEKVTPRLNAAGSRHDVTAPPQAPAPLFPLSLRAALLERYSLLEGRSCWSRAVAQVEGACNRMSDETQAHLAMGLLTCHLEMSGRVPHTCRCTSTTISFAYITISCAHIPHSSRA